MPEDRQPINSLSTGAERSGISTGAVMPRDMTVRLVRADSATAETFLSAFGSIFLSVFSVYLGLWLADPKFSTACKVACVFFGLFALAFIGIWIGVKVKQGKNTITIPQEVLNNYQNETSD